LKIIVPLQAGGAIDVFVRALAKEFENRTGGSVVVENRAGANTIIAANACKSAAPDGYTICLLTRSTVSINPELYKKLSYDPLKDFEPITNAFFGQQIVILNKNVPVNTFAELVEYSKKNPDKLNFASMGLGGDSHLIMEWLKHTSGAKIAHVPYKGFPEAMTSFKANDIQMIALLVGNPDLARQIRDGEVKGLLLPGSKRSELVPAVPTFAESGLRGDQTAFTPWFGLFAPKGTPAEHVDKLNSEFNAIMTVPEFRERLLVSKGFTPAGTKPDAFAKFLVEDRKAAAELVAISGVKLEE
ncbi:MAG TPA: tripartite tricarboxylate transporter substrate binding protein, partial [Xanthobacteraceae bacterium]